MESDLVLRISEAIDAKRDELIEFTRQLVSCLSENPPGDERAVAAMIREKMVAWDLPEPEVWAMEPSRPNVICTCKGSGGGRTLLYNAHTDTKPIGKGTWTYDPYHPEIVDGRLYGRGSTDMKGSVAAMMAAAWALRVCKVDLKGDLILALTADEEAGSTYGAAALLDRGVQADAVVVTEPSGRERSFDSLCLASRGVCCAKITVYGTQMHSSLSDQVGCVNASVKLAKVLSRMAETFKARLMYVPHRLYPQGPTVNPGVLLSGGVFYGVVPGEAWFGSDIRVLPGMTFEGVKADLEAFLCDLEAEDPALQTILSFEDPPLGWTPAAEIEAHHPLVVACMQATEAVLGTRPKLTGFAATTDARFFHHQLGIPTISAFGPGLISLAHAPDEYVEVEDVVKAAKIFALAAIGYIGLRLK